MSALSYLLPTGLLLSTTLVGPPPPPLHHITLFSVISRDCRERTTDRLVRASRTFHSDGLPRALVIDVETFDTEVIDPIHLECDDPATVAAVEASPLGRAIRESTAPPYPLQNDGVVHATHPVHGIFLTADLCPAIKERFETRLFRTLEAVSRRTGEPVPIGLSVSGKWMRQHPEDFNTLVHLSEADMLDITWVNHSYTHPYRRGEKVQDNFLLESGLNPNGEIEGVEIALLRHGEVPSAFFRFPGLVSNHAWIEALHRHSLIPLGADAWLALGQKPKSGSVILIHANGNEPEGVTLFLKALPKIQAIGPFLPLSDLF